MKRSLPVAIILLVSLSGMAFTVRAQDGASCTLPNNGGQSKCIRLHYCDSFLTIIRNSGGTPSSAEAANIRMHSCGGNLVCCPDNAVKIPITPAVAITPKPSQLLQVPAVSDLNKLSSHRHIGLLNEKECGSSSVDRIIGGKMASPGELPWMALLQYKARLDEKLSFNCGGALISQFYVITAAHCVTRELHAVRLGEHDISTAQDVNPDGTFQDSVQDILIDRFIRHPQYNNREKINDIALLRLKTPADTSKRNVKTICLPTTEDSQIENVQEPFKEKMEISGWGRVENGRPSDVLLKAYVPYVSINDCRQKFSEKNLKVYDSYLCAGGKNKTDTCHGDSGGPIQTAGLLNGKAKTILYGVVSVGVDCLNPDIIYPGIYTNVAHYLDWILDNMTS